MKSRKTTELVLDIIGGLVLILWIENFWLTGLAVLAWMFVATPIIVRSWMKRK